MPSASTACASSVQSRAAACAIARTSNAIAEHLRSLRLPQLRAIFRAHHARRGSIGVAALQRIGHRNRQQASDAIVTELRDQPRECFARRAGSRRIMHQHPVVVATGSGQRLQRVADGIAARSAATTQDSHAVARANFPIELHVVPRNGHGDAIEAQRIAQTIERARKQRPSGQTRILLGAGRSEARSASGSRNQREQARPRSCRHNSTAIRSSSSGRNPIRS